MNVNYKEENETFELFLKYNNQELKDHEDNEYEICSNISKLDTCLYVGNKVQNIKIKNYFLKVINDLGSITKDYYMEKIKKVKIKKDKYVDTGEAFIKGNGAKQNVYLPKNDLYEVDLVSFSHETGHIPTLVNGSLGDYFEYGEVLSIFFEYLAFKKIKKSTAYENFYNSRIHISKEMALSYLELSCECPNSDEEEKYIDYMKRDNYKYLLSFEYALNLIDIFNKDKKEVSNLIDNIITQKENFRSACKRYDIDCDKFKILSKSFK